MVTNLALILILVFLAAYILFLVIEVNIHERRLKTIPVRITVTGTRGKTSITRALGSILRESGKTVLAKTTGTEAKLILPDGSEEYFRTRKPANIIEQKRLVRRASKLKVDFLICEIMSIRPENHKTETFKLLKPHYTVIANLYPDHLDVGEEGRMGALYANDIFPGSKVIMHQEELDDELSKCIKERNAELILLPGASSPAGNLDLVRRVSGMLGSPLDAIEKGIDNK